MRTTSQAIKEANEQLEKYLDDSEVYHIEYDSIIEERLRELDPVFMEEVPYNWRVSRWYA